MLLEGGRDGDARSQSSFARTKANRSLTRFAFDAPSVPTPPPAEGKGECWF